MGHRASERFVCCRLYHHRDLRIFFLEARGCTRDSQTADLIPATSGCNTRSQDLATWRAIADPPSRGPARLFVLMLLESAQRVSASFASCYLAPKGPIK